MFDYCLMDKNGAITKPTSYSGFYDDELSLSDHLDVVLTFVYKSSFRYKIAHGDTYELTTYNSYNSHHIELQEDPRYKTITRLLITRHTNIEERKAALRWAIPRGYLAIVRILMEFGVNIHDADCKALFSACVGKQVTMTEFLIDHGADLSVLPCIPPQLYDEKVAALLIHRGANRTFLTYYPNDKLEKILRMVCILELEDQSKRLNDEYKAVEQCLTVLCESYDEMDMKQVIMVFDGILQRTTYLLWLDVEREIKKERETKEE